MIRKREGVSNSEKVAERLHELKPHVSIADALNADERVVSLLNFPVIV